MMADYSLKTELNPLWYCFDLVTRGDHHLNPLVFCEVAAAPTFQDFSFRL